MNDTAISLWPLILLNYTSDTLLDLTKLDATDEESRPLFPEDGYSRFGGQ